ncbi:MAG: deoxyribonuclease IV [Erysipelotrichaceae bacterium]|nr:deoxyribonuclease IV [Erysipelotrichaceae bacterium]
MKIGCHVGNSGPLMLAGSIKEALSYDANCFMVYLGPPQNTIRKPIESMNATLMAEIAKENNINLDDVIIHAPYIVNLARKDPEKFEFAVRFIATEVSGVHNIGCKYLVLHPGSAVDSERNEALNQVARGINEIIKITPDARTVIAIETMAGKGNEVGRTFEEIKYIIDQVENKSRVGVCLDTCHVNDGGYDLVNNYENVIKEFDEVIGLEYLKVIHVNDSKNPLASHKDRHENIGFGALGFETVMKIFNDERFINIPKILETPYVASLDNKNNYPPYKYEIAMIKSGVFDPNLKDKIRNI